MGGGGERAEDVPGRAGGPQSSPVLGWFGRLAGPPLAVVVYLVLPGEPGGLTDAGRATAAVVVLMAVLWMTEAMPLSATALVPLVAFPVLGILPYSDAASPYAHEVVLLLLGGFMIARGMEQWGLHRRIALLILLAAGTRPARLVAGFMVATAFLSMWISNTATTVLMLPIAVSVLGLVLAQARSEETKADPGGGVRPGDPLPVCLLLAIAYSASIGSVGTLIGTPPNLIMKAFLEERYGIEIGFAQWMAVGVPLVAVFLPLAWLVLTRVVFPLGGEEIPGGRAFIRQELAKLGRISRGEAVVLGVFVSTALAWIAREPVSGLAWVAERAPWVEGITDTTIALVAALLLFAFPVHPRRGEFALGWESARKLPWGVLILIGGGLSLAAAVQANGVDAWIGERLRALDVLPTAALVAATVAAVILLTEYTSNTATAATLLPILGGLAVAIGLDPLLLVVPAAIAASCAFMMPAATPPNAVVFGAGYLTIPQMVRAGVLLNLAGIGLIVALTYTAAALVLGIAL